MADIEKNGVTPPPFQTPESDETTTPPPFDNGATAPSSKSHKFNKGYLWAIGIFVAFMALAYCVGDDESADSSKPAATESSVTSSTPTPAKSRVTSSDSAENAAQDVANSGGHRVTSEEAMAIAAAGEIPEVPNPMSPVQDYAGLFSEATVLQMEDSLKQLSRQTSNQIVVVTVTNLGDYTPNDFAVKLGEKWGVGTKGTDNGVVILIKAKTADSKGQIYIAPGRGLEGALPDAFCKRLVEDEMIPILKKDGNDYAGATWKALNVMMPICRGEYSVERYEDDAAGDTLIELIIYLLVFGGIGWYLYYTFKDGGSSSGTSYTGRHSSYGSGGFGGFSGGSSGGGFSFGGGSFGGGGAGGSW